MHRCRESKTSQAKGRDDHGSRNASISGPAPTLIHVTDIHDRSIARRGFVSANNLLGHFSMHRCFFGISVSNRAHDDRGF
jgi:hypothetical protein